MIYFRIFDARAGGPGYPAPGGASPRYKFSGPDEFLGPSPGGAAAPPGVGFARVRPRAPADLEKNHNTQGSKVL